MNLLSLALLSLLTNATPTTSTPEILKTNPRPKISAELLPRRRYGGRKNEASDIVSIDNGIVFQNESLLILNRNYNERILLSCDAPYPISWTMESVGHDWVKDTVAERHVPNFTDPSTYTYSMSLELYKGELAATHVAKFICEGIHNTTSSVMLVVFELPSFFNVNWQTKVQLGTFDGKARYYSQKINWNSTVSPAILVPCFTHNVNEVGVELYYNTNGSLVPLGENNILNFVPFVGFYIHPRVVSGEWVEIYCTFEAFNDTNPISTRPVFEVFGNKKPEHASANNSIILFEVYKDLAHPIPRNQSLNFKVDGLGHGVCCAVGMDDYPWLIRVERTCTQPLLCMSNTKNIMDFHSRWRRYFPGYVSHYVVQGNKLNMTYSNYNATCYKMLENDEYRQNQPTTIVSCIKPEGKEHYSHQGIISDTWAIFGNSTTEQSFTIENVRLRFNSWRERSFYISDVLVLTCKANSFYYAKGMFWEIHFSNNATERVPGVPFVQSGEISENQIRISYEIKSTMLARIDCIAPLWNSTEWVTKSFYIDSIYVATSPSHPTMRDTKVLQNISFYAGDEVELDCGFEGIPTPSYRWTFPSNHREFEITDSSRTLPNTSSALRYLVQLSREEDPLGYATKAKFVTIRSKNRKSIQGLFSCTASNPGGKATIQFYVTGIERTKSKEY